MSLRVAHKGRQDAAKVGAMPRQCPGGLPWRAARSQRAREAHMSNGRISGVISGCQQTKNGFKRMRLGVFGAQWPFWLVLLLAKAAIAQSGLASFMVIKLVELLPGLIRTLSICTAPFPTIVFCKQQRKRGACARNMTACGHGA